jgi:hypothetical protein
MANPSKTVQVTVYSTPYGSPGPIGPSGPQGIGLQPLNFNGIVVVGYGTVSNVEVDIVSEENALTVGNSVKISFPNLSSYIYGTIINYDSNSLSFLQLSGTAISGNIATFGTIIFNGLPGEKGSTGEISAYTFDGGSPSSVYTAGPVFDCGGVN